MSVRAIPTMYDGTPFYDFDLLLDGENYTFEFQWNERDKSWYFSIFSANGARLTAGIRVVLRWPLLHRFGLKDAPPGEIVLVDVDKSGVEAGLYDLGNRTILTYIPAGE